MPAAEGNAETQTLEQPRVMPVEADGIQEIAKLPSREDLIAKLLFLLQSPVVRLVRGLGAIVPQFVQVLDQIRQTKEEE